MEELKRMLYSRFKEEAIIRQCGDNRVELEVSTHIPKEEWKKRMEGFEDTSKTISDSWIYNGIRIVLFTGAVKNQKKNFNFAYQTYEIVCYRVCYRVYNKYSCNHNCIKDNVSES